MEYPMSSLWRLKTKRRKADQRAAVPRTESASVGYTIEMRPDEGYAIVRSKTDPNSSTTVRIGPSAVEPVVQAG